MTRKKFFQALGVVTLTLAAWMAWDIAVNGFGVGYYIPLVRDNLYLVPLKKVDPEAEKMCQLLTTHPLFNRNPVIFLVDYGPRSSHYYAYTYPKKGSDIREVILGTRAIHCSYLPVIVAHELGHLQLHEESIAEPSPEERIIRQYEEELEADAFAAQICGKNNVIKFLEEQEDVMFRERKIKALKENHLLNSLP